MTTGFTFEPRQWKKESVSRRRVILLRFAFCGLCGLIVAFCSIIPRGAGAHEKAEMVVGEGRASHEKIKDQKIVDEDWITEKTGNFIPMDSQFLDSSGKPVVLRSFITKPTLILPDYFFCPNSCSLNLSYLANAIRTSTLKGGDDFKVISLSFNPDETPEDARDSKKTYLKLLPGDFPADSWRFLVGTDTNIKAVMNALGYRFKRMPDGTFVHPSALIVVSKDGRIIKYVYGAFLPGDVDMALLEAKNDTPALSVKRILGFCFNSGSEKSGTFLQKIKIGIILGFLVLGGLFFVFLRRGKKRMPRKEDGSK